MTIVHITTSESSNDTANGLLSSSFEYDLEKTCSKGLLIPLFPYEYTWNPTFRAILYCVGLLYCSLGVTIIAGLFMGAIEKITSRTRKVYLSKPPTLAGENSAPDVIHVRLWNDTVANLTLMALGSSAPEILLAVVEIVGKGFESGELGPGTIVGSAAFNLLIITAVCIVAIPDQRRIRTWKVFLVTSAFCLGSYLWLIVILECISPDIIDSWEAAITLAFFPIMVSLAYWADIDFKFCCKPLSSWSVKPGQIELGMNGVGVLEGDAASSVRPMLFTKDGQVNKDGLVAFYRSLRKYSKLSDHEAAVLAATKLIETQPHSRMWYGVGAVRNITGGKKLQPVLSKKLKMVYETVNNAPDLDNIIPPPAIQASNTKDNVGDDGLSKRVSIIEFESASISVPENIGKVTVNLIRYGNLENAVRVRVESFDGTAKQGSDYLAVNEFVIFPPGIKEAQIQVTIVDDNQWEPDEEFFLRVSMIEHESIAQLGRLSIMEIIILDDDEPGFLTFHKRGLLVKESCEYASIEVSRVDGADGVVSVYWKTIDRTATSPKDYLAGEGKLIFKHREKLKIIEIPVVDSSTETKDSCFEVELFDPDGGVRLGKISKIAITITNDDAFTSFLNRMLVLTTNNLKSMEVHQATWKEQIEGALTVNGGNVEGATNFDYLMHFVTFGWKVIFSLIPPPGLFGGWLCFFTCLTAIGVLTAIVGDLASIFGCLVGLKDTVTAITFVSLGTSLPDLFASKVAAIQEKYADNAIGNVTGSNSVNVFLGLGLPWLIAAIVHEYNGKRFEVKAGSLSFSVGVYSSVALVTILLLFVRRFSKAFGCAELGGPTKTKWFSGILLVLLWILYIILSALQAYDYI